MWSDGLSQGQMDAEQMGVRTHGVKGSRRMRPDGCENLGALVILAGSGVALFIYTPF